MGRARSNRSGQRRFSDWQRAGVWRCDPATPTPAWGAGCFRPRLEVLEDRLYPGDAVLGVWALTLWGQSLAASPPNELAGARARRRMGSRLECDRLRADALSPLSVLDDTSSRRGAAGKRGGPCGHRQHLRVSRRVRWAALRGRYLGPERQPPCQRLRQRRCKRPGCRPRWAERGPMPARRSLLLQLWATASVPVPLRDCWRQRMEVPRRWPSMPPAAS